MTRRIFSTVSAVCILAIGSPAFAVPPGVSPSVTPAPKPVAYTGAARTFSAADLFALAIRSNAGTAMTDTLPAAGTLSAGWYVFVINSDPTGSLTITPAGGTIGGGSAYVLAPGQSAQIFSDGTNFQVLAGGSLVAAPASVTSLAASGAITGGDFISSVNNINAGGALTAVGYALVTGGATPAVTMANGYALLYGGTAPGLVLRGQGTGSDFALLNSAGASVCSVGHGLNLLSCQQITVTGTTVSNVGAGFYRPSSGVLGFATNSLSAGFIDSTQHPRFGGAGSPTIASGACGVMTNGSVAGNDVSGKITVGAVATTTCTISFATAYDTTPRGVLITPANSVAAAQGTTLAYVSAIANTSFTISGAALANTVYNFQVQ